MNVQLKIGKQLTKFLSGVNHCGGGIVVSEVLQVLLPRPSGHRGEFLRSTTKVAKPFEISFKWNVSRWKVNLFVGT